MTTRLVGAVSSLVVLAACSSSASNATSSLQNLNQGAPRAASAPAVDAWATCYVEPDTSTSDPFFQRDEVHCTYASKEGAVIEPSNLIVEVRGTRGDSRQNSNAMLSPAVRGRDTVVAAVSSDDYPLTLVVTVVLPPRAVSDLGISQAGVLSAELAIADRTAFALAAPLKVARPFGVWDLSITNATQAYGLRVDAFDVDLGAFRVGQDPNGTHTLRAEPVVSSAQAASQVAHIAAPPSVTIGATYDAAAARSLKVTLDGPGDYVADDAGFHRPDAVDGGAPDTGTGNGDDAGNPPPDPTCGAVGQNCCGATDQTGTCYAGGTCYSDNGFLYMCAACGAPGQICCGATDQTGTCGAGSTCHTDNGTSYACAACGAPGQICCGATDQTGTCGAGSSCGTDNGTSYSCR